MKKDIRLIIFFISIIILFLKNSFYYANTIEKNWGIVIPEFSFYEEIYEKDSGTSFLGDGIRYHVYSYKNDHYIEAWLRWEEKESKTRHYLTYRDAVIAWLDEMEIEKDFYPDFDNCLYYYEKDMMDEIIIFWDESNNKFYVIEYFM